MGFVYLVCLQYILTILFFLTGKPGNYFTLFKINIRRTLQTLFFSFIPIACHTQVTATSVFIRITQKQPFWRQNLRTYLGSNRKFRITNMYTF